MYCAALIGRGCPTSSTLSQLAHHVPALAALSLPNSSVVSCYAVNSINSQIRLFRHERKNKGRSNKKLHKIVTKVKLQQPEVYPCLKERLRELDPKLRDPELHQEVNIGFDHWQAELPGQRKKRQQNHILKLKQDKALGKLSRTNKLEIDIQDVQQHSLTEISGALQCRVLAQHCGIFQHLFGPHAYYNPVVPLSVEYDYSDDEVSVVYRGNIIKPREAATAPNVEFSSPSDALWTLKLTNPDGNLYSSDSECIHWLVTNIKGGELSTGDVLVPYMPPVPPRGAGYQRMVFVLYQQTGTIDSQDQYRIDDPNHLRSRSFSTSEFYRQHEKLITPAGLCWFNTDWDSSIPHYYHDFLGMKEPIYEYEFPKAFLKPEMLFPKNENFLFYMDMHREPKQLSTEMFMKRLKSIDPFTKEAYRLPYPSAQPINHNLPSWQRQEIKRERLGQGKYRELYRQDYDNTATDNTELEAAAKIEAEKNHTLRLGIEWKKIYIGKKKQKLVAAAEKKLLEQEEELDNKESDDSKQVKVAQ